MLLTLMPWIVMPVPALGTADQIILTFKPEAAESDVEAVKKRFHLDHIHRFKSSHSGLFKTQTPINELKQMVAESAGSVILDIIPNYPLEFFSPDDPYLHRQYFHQIIDTNSAWDITRGTPKVRVAIIDSGIDYNHQDLAPNFWVNQGELGQDSQGRDKRSNNFDDDGNGYVDDWRGWDFGNHDNDPMDEIGHGTLVAGIAGAAGNNRYGVAGIAWNLSLMGIKMSGYDQDGDHHARLASAIQAVEYATSAGAHILNLSWGFPLESAHSFHIDPLKEALIAAGKRGILIIAAAGNHGANNDLTYRIPTNYKLPFLISVAASDARDTLAEFSNYGVKHVDLAAPGVNIFTTSSKGFGSHDYRSGTSMATPMVAGTAALLMSVYPDLRGAELRERILSSVDTIPNWHDKIATGGRLNTLRAISP